MGERTTIEWTDHTFNPWWGCTKVSPGCDYCYAESWAKRFGVKWGPGEARRPASERTWSEPYKWNEKAKKDGVRRRVFCASMADVFDNEAPSGAREWLWEIIEETNALDWLLLTKRVGNVMTMIPERWRARLPNNVWVGATIVNQEEADRDIPKLLRVPAAVRFLSCEPLLGPILLDPDWLCAEYFGHANDCGDDLCALNGDIHSCIGQVVQQPSVGWVITGAESGRNARTCDLDWVRILRDYCEIAGVPFFFKQDVREGIKLSTPILDGRSWTEFPRAALCS